MRLEKGWVLGIALCVAAAAPARAAVPFGVFEGLPVGQNAGAGILPLTGWALDDDGIERVEIFVDGVVVGIADIHQNRPDVQLAFPGYPNPGNAGFGFQWDSTPFINDVYSVTARVTSNTGEQVFLEPRQIQVYNTTHILAPFGQITFPNPSAELFGTCDLTDPTPRYNVIEGWALDVGVESGDTGVKYVELLINGSLWANSHTDCFFDSAQGGYVNCYGLPSLDVEDLFPTVANSPHARWRFVLDVGVLINGFGYSVGFHELTIRVGDVSGQVANVAEIPVIFTCAEFTDNEGSFGFIDDPENGELTSGTTTVSGWALDREGVFRVQVYLDGEFVGNAVYGLPRGDVATLYPGYPDSLAAGWTFGLDTTGTSDGQHHLQAVAIDDLGASTILGERYFTVRNEIP
jgi:N-acetylmuramoyl-L-alanine amidase